MKKISYSLALLLFSLQMFSQTSWKGTTSTSWQTASNWTSGVPTSTIDAIIGDANFTGAFQPILTGTSAACKTLTIGTGTISSSLSITKNLNVWGNITIGSNGTILNNTSSFIITLKGNWSNSGTYTSTASTASVTFSGTAQTITGTTIFRGFVINSGSTVTLGANITVNGAMSITGTLNPTPLYAVSGSGVLTVNSGGTILVQTTTFTGNYTHSGGTTLNGRGTVNYASSTINQTIDNSLTYGYLRISGGTIKTLAGNLPSLSSSTANAGRIYVDAGTFDLLTYTANRTSGGGGSFIVSANAIVKIGGTNSFPVNYSTVTLAAASTINYYGNNQTIPNYNYGNLTFESTSGAAVKTMPSTAMTIAGDLTSSAGTGTSISFTAGDKITVNKNVSLNATTFNAGSYSHTFKANWTNDGTFNGGTSSVSFKGTNAFISGTGTNDFNNLTFTAAGISASGATNINVSGNISTTGAGIFTHLSGGTCSLTGSSKTISGTGLKFFNCTINGTYTTSKNYSVSGNLTVNGSFTGNSTSVVTLDGALKTITGTGTISFFGLNILGTITTTKNYTITSNLTVSSGGSYTATAGITSINGTGTSLAGIANLFDVTINAGKTLRMGSNSILGIANTFIKTGTLDVTTNIPNTVTYNSAGTQTVIGTTYNNLILANGGTKNPSTTTTVNNDFTINTSVVFNASTFTHTINRHFVNNGTFNANTSTIVLGSSNAANITGATTFNNLTISKTTNVVSVNLISNIIVSTLAMTIGNMQTGSNAVNITTTRTGNGIIIGTIVRNHVFTNGTVYYFEGPQNAVTFTSPSSINSVTVKVTLGTVIDFDPSVECVNREYEIAIPSGTYTNATFRYHYEDNELNAFSEPFIALYKFNSGVTWDSVGFTSRSTASNYVEQTGIINLAGRYTCSGIRNIIRWNGSVSNAWETAANWTTYSGADMSNRVPTSTDGADFGSIAFINQPIINSVQQIALMRFGSLQPSIVTINSGTLTNLGSIRGQWSGNASHTIDVASSSLTVGTNLDLSDGIPNHDITLKIGSGTANISNDLNQSSTGSVIFTGNGTLSLSGNYNYTAGTFTAGIGTTTYTGGEAQIVAPVLYNNLSFTKSTDRASINSAITVNGNLTTSTGGEIAANANITVGGNITIGVSTTFIENNATINIGGNWVRSGIFAVSNGTVNFNGSTSQSVNATIFNNVIVNKSTGTLTLTGDLIINNDLSLNSGTLDLATFLADRSNPGGTLTLGAATLLKVAGAANFPNYYVNDLINVTNTVEYYGSVAQQVLDVSYGNLTFTNGATNAKALLGNTTINGDLLINSSSTVNPDSTTITLYGNFTNSGTYTPSGSTLILKGVSKIFTGNTTLHDLSIINGSYTVNSGTISIDGDFIVDTLSSMNFGSNNVSLDGDLTNRGSLTSNGTATFTGTRVQTFQLLNAITSSSTGIINFNGTVAPILNSTSSPAFATVNINNTAGITPSVPWVVYFACNIAAGSSFNGGALTHTFYGNFINNGTVNSSGELKFTPSPPFSSGATIQLDGVSFTSTGRVSFGGTSSITIIDINPYLNEVYVTNTNAVGVRPPNNWTINQELYIGPGATFKGGSLLSHTIVNNYTNNGTLDGESSTVTFTGNPISMNGIGTCTFYNLTLATASNITLNKSIGISKDFVVNGIFTGTGRTVKFTGSSASTISGTTSPLTLDDVEQDKTAATTSLLIPVIITGNFILTNGILNTTAVNLLTLTDDATSTSGSSTSYVDGLMKKIGDDAFVFPLGNASYWARLGISAPSTITDAFTAQYFSSAYTNTTAMATTPTPVLNNVSTVEYWTLDKTAGSSSVIVKLYWENAARSGITNYTSDLVVAHWNGSVWENAGQTAVTASDPGDVSSTSQSSFSPFTFGSLSGATPLPIELLSFTAILNSSKTADVKWSTATETNSDYFIIERSADGIAFENIKTVAAAGNSTSIINYSTIDENPLKEVSYYRLKEIDFDGNYTYSQIVSINNDDFNMEVNLFPNPSFDGAFNLEITGSENEEILVILYNSTGQTVYSKAIITTSNQTRVAIETGGKLPSGIYWITGTSKNELFRKKLIVQ